MPGITQLPILVLGCLVSHPLPAEITLLKASVTKATASVDDSFDDAEYIHVRLDSKLLVTNTQKNVILIPRTGGQVTQIDERVVDSTERGKNWKKLTQTSWFDDGTQRFSDCQKLARGRSTVVDEIKASLFLRKDEYKLRTSNELRIRMHLDLVCRESGTKDSLAVRAITEEFTVTVLSSQ